MNFTTFNATIYVLFRVSKLLKQEYKLYLTLSFPEYLQCLPLA